MTSRLKDDRLLTELRQGLEEVSIRGRMAFALECLERVAASCPADCGELWETVAKLWAFTSAEQLDVWSAQLRGVFDGPGPIGSIDDGRRYWARIEDPPDGTGEPEEFPDAKLGHLLYALILEAIEVGTGNLYSGTVSSFTLEPATRVADMLLRNQFQLPNLDRFRRSPFSEADGWGEPRDRSFFQASNGPHRGCH